MSRANPTLVLVHTVPPLVEPFTRWSGALLPGVRVLHVLDEPMIERIRQRGLRWEEDGERLLGHVTLAESIGADAVLVTCSTVSQVVGRIRGRCRVPLVAIDEALAAEAVRAGERVAVLATAPTTLEPSRALLEAAASKAGTRVEIDLRLVDGALQALLGGDGATHDRLLGAAVRDAAARADVVVLAQASMARVLDTLDPPPAVPVLASPQLALREVARLLAAAAPESLPA